MQWDSSCIIITFQPAVLCRIVQKLQQLGVSMIGNIAPFAHSNGNILLLLLLSIIIIIIYYYYLSSGQFYNYCLIQLQTTRIV